LNTSLSLAVAVAVQTFLVHPLMVALVAVAQVVIAVRSLVSQLVVVGL
jgi:hypothetical protein